MPGGRPWRAEKFTAIEQRRFHADLRPDIGLVCASRGLEPA